MSTEEKLCCKDCQFGKDVGYRQILCKKTNEFQPELHSCKYVKPKEDSRK